MESIKVNANAKINLTLDILGKRPDGYHELETIMQSVSLCDYITVTKSDKITVSCSDESLSGEGNLAFAAAKKFFEKTAISGGADIFIEKKIPKAAGLGGGSTDAAAVLRALNTLYNANLNEDELCSIAVTLGADVPFCVLGGTRLCKGIGEKMSSLPAMPDCYIVIVKEGDKVSTGKLYSDFDNNPKGKRPNTKAAIKALEENDLENIANNLCNVFEPSVPRCEKVKANMLSFGALAASLSGSGPSVFAIFNDIEKAENCKNSYKENAFICKPL